MTRERLEEIFKNALVTVYYHDSIKDITTKKLFINWLIDNDLYDEYMDIDRKRIVTIEYNTNLLNRWESYYNLLKVCKLDKI